MNYKKTIIKLVSFAFVFFTFTNFVNAETLTYDVCESGCEYKSLSDVSRTIGNADDLSDVDIIINFSSDNYSSLRIYNPTLKSLTINCNNYNVGLNESEIMVKNIEINECLNSKNIYIFNAEQVSINKSDIMLLYYWDLYFQPNSEEINFSKIFNIDEISLNNLKALALRGNIKIENLDLKRISLMPFGGTINIYNSKIDKVVNVPESENVTTNIHNSKFKTLKYVNILSSDDPAYNEYYQFVDTFPIDSSILTNDIYDIDGTLLGIQGRSNTTVYFDKETKLKLGDKLNLVDYLDYYTEDKEIEYTIEDESIAKIENKELISLKEGTTKVTITTDEGHVVYRINLTVISSSPGKINKINPPTENFANSDFNADNLDNIIPLTSEEQVAKESGKNIEVYLEVKDVSESISREEKAIINEKIDDKETLAMYLDVSLFKQIEGEEASKIEETTGNIKVSLKVPENLKSNNPSKIRKYYILRLHNGVVDKLETELNGDILSFETDKFSTYALTYEDVDNPKTGDSILTYVVLSIISLIGLIIYKKVGKRS